MTGIQEERRQQPVADGGLLVTDLLASPQVLAQRLAEALAARQWLDAFLLAAGLGQVTEDRLHADPFLLSRAASYLGGRPAAGARLAGRLSAAAAGAARTASGPAAGPLRHARGALAGLTELLAAQVLTPGEPADPAPLLAALSPALPALAGEVLRLPACFHSFDQHPDDIRWLVDAFRERYPASDTPLCVLGVRTSGSYLAPLHAAALRLTGSPHVTVLTYRPGRPFQRWERAALRSVARAGGRVVVCDDPPGSGTSLAAAARAAAAAGGFPDQAVVLLVSLFGTAADLPATLSRWPAVLQPWAQWSVHRRLAAGPAGDLLAGLLGPDTAVTGMVPLGPGGPAAQRGHERARFTAVLTDRRTGTRSRREIVVEGAGLGYLGRQGLAVARALPGHLPHVYGFADGLLVRDWLPDAPQAPDGAAVAEAIAGYVTARQRALPAPGASTARMGGRDPAWEVAARLLSGQFGPLAVPARPLLLDPLARRLLAHGDPTVLDGKTDRRHWLPGPAATGLRKVDFYQRGFGHLDLTCYDPVCDLAGAAADPPGPGFERQLRESYRRLTGKPVDPERWLLYRLAQLWRLGCAGDLSRDQVRQQSANAVHDYLAGRYLTGLAPGRGPLCAIDLDGVLECDRLGYPATSPAGALALRALIAHDYRPVLMTGRSLPEVRDRCLTFGLAGGAAEYGAVLRHPQGEIDLRPAAARELLSQIRRELQGRDEITIDQRYRYTVRAATAAGPVPGELLARIPALAHPGIRVIHGEGQTDITAAGVDKGSALAALAARLGGPGCALAVGDTASDLPMFARSALARAPRNARLPAGSRVPVTRGAYQAGLLDACASLLGHRPGRCPQCRPPACTPRSRAVLTLLNLRANGLATIPVGTTVLGALMVRRNQW